MADELVPGFAAAVFVLLRAEASGSAVAEAVQAACSYMTNNGQGDEQSISHCATAIVESCEAHAECRGVMEAFPSLMNKLNEVWSSQ